MQSKKGIKNHRGAKGKMMLVLVVACITVSLLSTSLHFNGKDPPDPFHGVLNPSKIHDPISINGNTELEDFITVGNEQTQTDNIPPTIEITTPKLGYLYVNLFDTQFKIPFIFAFTSLIIGKINITVDAEDNTSIEWVKIYIDDSLKVTFNEPPYIWLWSEPAFISQFELKAISRDISGNEATEIINVWKIQLF